VTVTVYVFVVVPSPAVATTFIAEFAPTTTGCAPDAVPDVVDDPPTVTDAADSVSVGVMVMEDTAFSTVAVYAVVPDANEGDSVPELSIKLFKVATVFAPAVVLVTATVYVVLPDVLSPADTTVVTVVADPAASEMAADAAPDVAGIPWTVTPLDPPTDVSVGVTVTDATLFGTVVVYDVVLDAKAGVNVPT
jgi:hypothetical protein